MLKGEAGVSAAVSNTPLQRPQTPLAEYTTVHTTFDPSFAFGFDHMTSFTKTSLINCYEQI